MSSLVRLISAHEAVQAPPLQVSDWLNTNAPIALEDIRGRVVVLHAFQMLCPGCVAHGLPQASQMFDLFPQDEVAVIGLHTVFEHHIVTQPRTSLEAFVHEYRLRFPIGIDLADPRGDVVPQTMRALGLRGTPSLLLLDKRGRIRLHTFGRVDDLSIGVAIGLLIAESVEATVLACDDNDCRAPDARMQQGPLRA